MTYIQNTTERVLHPAYTVPSPDGKQPSGRYLQLDSDTPGVPPGSWDIDDGTAKLIREHPTNCIFFDTGMLVLKDGVAPKIESSNRENKPKIFKADPAALAPPKASRKSSRSDPG